MTEIAAENGRISNSGGLKTLTLDRVILHTIVHHSSTSTYTPNFIEIKETFCGRTDERTLQTGFIRSTLSKSRPKKAVKTVTVRSIQANKRMIQKQCLQTESRISSTNVNITETVTSSQSSNRFLHKSRVNIPGDLLSTQMKQDISGGKANDNTINV